MRMTTPPTASAPATSAELGRVLKALADPTRLSIFLLLREGETCVCELAGLVGHAENLVSHHLGVLRRAGLVCDRRDPSDARWVYYQLDAGALDRLGRQLGTLFDPNTLGMRTPTCGPSAPIVLQRAAAHTG